MRISDWSSDVCSSDLAVLLLEGLLVLLPQGHHRAHVALVEGGEHGRGVLRLLQAPRDGLAQPGHAHALFALSAGGGRRGCGRSEEHTSELQSLMRISYAVFCLKKKKKNAPETYNTNT